MRFGWTLRSVSTSDFHTSFTTLLIASICYYVKSAIPTKPPLIVSAFVALFLPGAWVYYRFINTVAIKEDITYALPYRGEGRFR